MRRNESILTVLAAAFALGLSACAPISKPAAAAPTPPIVSTAPAPSPNPAPPPAPLSIPQTQVDLPPAQTVPQESLDLAPVVTEPAPPPVVTPVRPRSQRTNAAPAPHTDPAGPTGPTVAVPPEAERAPIGEILPPNEQRQLMAQVAGKRNEASQLLAALKDRHLTAAQSTDLGKARTFLRQSDVAEKRGDMRQADALADLALVLARELNGK